MVKHGSMKTQATSMKDNQGKRSCLTEVKSYPQQLWKDVKTKKVWGSIPHISTMSCTACTCIGLAKCLWYESPSERSEEESQYYYVAFIPFNWLNWSRGLLLFFSLSWDLRLYLSPLSVFFMLPDSRLFKLCPSFHTPCTPNSLPTQFTSPLSRVIFVYYLVDYILNFPYTTKHQWPHPRRISVMPSSSGMLADCRASPVKASGDAPGVPF